MRAINARALRQIRSHGLRGVRGTPLRHVATASSAADMRVTQLTSPPEVVEQKREQLQRIGPLGPAYVVAGWAARVLGGFADVIESVEMSGQRPEEEVFELHQPFPLVEEMVTVGSIRLHCVSPAPRRRDKPLMLMLHGFPECWYSWRHQMAEFGADYDVVAVDMRGYNDSDKPQAEGAYHLTTLVDDVAALVPALGHERCAVLVAHDWGGCVAWAAVAQHPQLFERLVVAALPHCGVSLTNGSAEQRRRSFYILQFQARGAPEKVLTKDRAAAMESFFRRPPVGLVRGRLSDEELEWFRASACKPGAMRAMLSYYRCLYSDLTQGAADSAFFRLWRTPIPIPTLVLHGDQDSALGVDMLRGIEAAVPLAQVYLLSPCSHWVQQDCPAETNQLMRQFLAQPVHPAAAGGGSE